MYVRSVPAKRLIPGIPALRGRSGKYQSIVREKHELGTSYDIDPVWAGIYTKLVQNARSLICPEDGEKNSEYERGQIELIIDTCGLAGDDDAREQLKRDLGIPDPDNRVDYRRRPAA